MKYYLIAGEASGDLHASNLMRALQQVDAAAEFRFYGGEKMQSAGGTLVKHYKELAYMGFIPVLLHLPTILRNMKQCKQDITAWQPDVLILIDYPGFNLEIAHYVHSHTDIPVYYYISPKIWAWKEHRIKNIRRDVDELFSILPFEIDFFENKHHYPIHYVGNPCVDAIEQFRREGSTGTTTAVPTIAILAGSRRQEIKDNLRTMLRAASQFAGYRIVLAAAPNIEPEYYRRYIPSGVEVEMVGGKTYQVLSEATAALVTSGTATLETAILRVPQVVCYFAPVGPFIRLLRRLLLKVKYISLVNLIVNREIVTELVADDMNVERLTSELSAILPGGAKRQQMLADYEEMNQRLGPAGASQRAAQEMYALLTRKP
ncbi:MAG: lipid-A-disaccharide synthase [Bacteroidaceae bacterium]|nr:lipid-A-disaccharide synthase [Bacteroidaceae bacterium]